MAPNRATRHIYYHAIWIMITYGFLMVSERTEVYQFAQSQPAITCSKLAIESRRSCEIVQVNNKDTRHSISPPLLSDEGDNFQFQVSKRGEGSGKKWIPGGGGDLKSSCHGYLPWGGGRGGLIIFLVRKTLKNMALTAQCQMLILAGFAQTTN